MERFELQDAFQSPVHDIIDPTQHLINPPAPIASFLQPQIVHDQRYHSNQSCTASVPSYQQNLYDNESNELDENQAQRRWGIGGSEDSYVPLLVAHFNLTDTFLPVENAADTLDDGWNREGDTLSWPSYFSHSTTLLSDIDWVSSFGDKDLDFALNNQLQYSSPILNSGCDLSGSPERSKPQDQSRPPAIQDPSEQDMLHQSCQIHTENTIYFSDSACQDAMSSPRDCGTLSCHLEISRTKTSVNHPNRDYKCAVAGCKSSFLHQSDLSRHERTVHMAHNARRGYRCAYSGCPKADKIFTRRDNYKQHAKRRHKDVDVELLTRKSCRLARGPEAPFVITTRITHPWRSPLVRKQRPEMNGKATSAPTTKRSVSN